MAVNYNSFAQELYDTRRNFVQKEWIKFMSKPKDDINPYTGLPTHDAVLFLSEEQISHIKKLNNRCLRLTTKLLKDMYHITEHMREKIKSGEKAYEMFNAEGYVFLDFPIYESPALKQFEYAEVKSRVIFTSQDFPKVEKSRYIIEDRLFYGNWQGFLRDLYDESTGKGIKLCTAFCELFDWSDLFTLEELMQVRPSDILSQIKIYI